MPRAARDLIQFGGNTVAKQLVIVESPSKAKTIGKYLGSDYVVKASMGHLRDLPKSKMGVDFEHDFQPQYEPMAGKEDVIRELQSAAKKADHVFLATDPDREGEAISWHLKEMLKLSDEKASRVTFNEITNRVISSVLCCGRKSAEAFLQAACSRWRLVWSWIVKMKYARLKHRNTGRLKRPLRGSENPAALWRIITGKIKSGNFIPMKRCRNFFGIWKESLLL